MQANVLGQETNADSTNEKNLAIYGLPVAFYSPETSLGFGGAGIAAFRIKGKNPSEGLSNIQLAVTYTLKKQLILLSTYQFYAADDKLNVNGELGYYKYFFEYNGIGNNANLEESYDVRFPRLRLNAMGLAAPNLYAGISYWYDNFDISDTDEGGELDQGLVPGSDGGIISGLGPTVNYDTRDLKFFPSKGWFANAELQFYTQTIGSDFEYFRFKADASHYIEMPWEHILAVNGYAEFLIGEPPFFQLPQMGGGKVMRGYYKGRYRDKQFMALQAEYRAAYFWKLGFTVYGGIGAVEEQFSGFQWSHLRPSYGAGLRILIDKEEKINIRIDYAFGEKGNSGLYLTIGEAF